MKKLPKLLKNFEFFRLKNLTWVKENYALLIICVALRCVALRCVALRCVVITKPSKTESTTKHINFSDMCVKGKFFVTTRLTNRDLRFFADAQNDGMFADGQT